MRIQAEVEMVNRSYNSKTKPARSSLAIGKKASVNCAFLVWSTAQNRKGTKFIIRDGDNRNVERLFTTFVHEGKLTVRFKAPAQDLCMRKSDPLLLKAFANVLRMCLAATSQEDWDSLLLSSEAYSKPATISQVTKPQTKMVVQNKKDYPITSSFPSTLEHLTASGLSLKRVDCRMLKLKQLVHLDLSRNNLKNMEVFGLPSSNHLNHLKELNLSDNQISAWPVSFCAHPAIQCNLRLLDLSGNLFKSVPSNVNLLKSLITLKMSCNPELCQLPATFGQLSKSLKNLQIETCPKLNVYPGSMARLRLDELAVSVGQTDEPSGEPLMNTTLNVPSLSDCCAAVVATHAKGSLTNEDAPHDVLRILDTMEKCFCLKFIHRSSCVKGYCLLPVQTIAQTTTLSSQNGDWAVGTVRLVCLSLFCSMQCYRRFALNAFAI